MFADDLPDGAWTAALIGAYWPGADAVEVLGAGADARQRWATHFDGYADHLRSVSQTHLAGQEGSAADAARALFSRGEHRARATAERNGVGHRSYVSARHCVTALREELARIAEDGNAAIGRIQEASIPVDAKVTGIVEVIADAQTRAHTKTAENSGSLLSHIQAVLDAHGADVSARAFAASHGVDPTPPRPPGLELLTQQVAGALAAAAGAPTESPGVRSAPAAAPPTPATPPPPGTAGRSASAPIAAAPPSSPAPAAVPNTGPNIPARPIHAGAAAALNPSNAGLAAGPSALVRRTVVAAAAPAHTERALAGAAPDRLTPLLAAVARQSPQLRWAVGERTDGSIVVVTDLAEGWIPPGIAIPEAVRLLEPGPRQGDLTDLLGDCTSVAYYAPGQELPADTGTVPMGTPETPAIDDLGWELARATKWRDGLPRLAHTLARAATTGTGWPDSEAALLGGHLHDVASRVLAAYPDRIDATDVGNWQLLATIAALVGGETTSAAYHFAWFRANS